jgi:ketosteroid isomerase-like protein
MEAATLDRAAGYCAAMSQKIPERWRLLYSTVTSGDLDGLMEFFHDDVEYLPFEESEAIQGLDAVRRYFEAWLDTWDSFQAEPTEFLARGDHVVVGEAYKGRGKDSGVEVAMQSWSVSLLRDDKIVRRDEFLDRAEALEAAGLSE